MLDIQGLPKNANGFRTTHTCELCGFEPKTKNKYREKQDHLVMKHFKERIDKIFPHCRPYSCPNTECSFEGKDKQALLRHYTGKHGVLELYLKEALLAKGINYHLSDSAKRKSMGNQNPEHKAKLARLSPPLAETVLLPASPEQMMADTTTSHLLPSEYSEPIIYSRHQPVQQTAVTSLPPLPSLPSLPQVPTTKLPSMSTLTKTKPTQSEVAAMIASFDPQEYQVAASVYPVVSHEESVVSSTTLDIPTLFLPVGDEANSKLPLILDNNIMWSSGAGQAITVDTNQTVPVFETSDSAFINLGDIDYDYLYPATVDPSVITQQGSSNSSSPSSQNVLPFTDL